MQFEMLRNNPRLLYHPRVAPMLELMLPPQPLYTCPACRVPVRAPPAEDFVLKSLVTTVAAAAGEQPPIKEVARRNQVGKGKSGPWDGFFPHARA